VAEEREEHEPVLGIMAWKGGTAFNKDGFQAPFHAAQIRVKGLVPSWRMAASLSTTWEMRWAPPRPVSHEERYL